MQYRNTTSIYNNEIIYNYKQLQHDYRIHQNNYKTTRNKLEYDYGVVHHGWKYGKWMNRLWIFDEKYDKSSRQELPWLATCPLNHATVVVFQLYISRLPVPPFFWGATSKGRGSFALAMSMSTQTKLRMNFQVSILIKYNPLYINDSLTTTQIQKHYLSHLLVISALNDSKLSCLLSHLFQFFF
jgi:hypothetical protein